MGMYGNSHTAASEQSVSSETEYWNSSVCFVLSQRGKRPTASYRLDKFGRPGGGSPEKKQSLSVIFGSPQGVPLCGNKSQNQRAWQLKATMEMIPNHSIYRSETRNQSGNDSPSELVSVEWDRAASLPHTPPPPPCPAESVLGITTGLLIEISVWSQIPSNHNSVLEPAGKPPNLSLGFQFCQGKCEKYHQEQPQC